LVVTRIIIFLILKKAENIRGGEVILNGLEAM